jgi:hypothetical protein
VSPQASGELRAKFPGSIEQAYDVLRDNFTDTKGVIRPKVDGYKPTKRESDAIDYLFLEWDFCYEPRAAQPGGPK